MAIGAQVGLGRIFKESHRAIDLVAMFRPVTKWSETVLGVTAVPEMGRKAFDLAQIGRPGAVFLAVPGDAEQEPVPRALSPLHIPRAVNPRVAEHDLAEAARMIDASARTIVLAGHGVARSGASEALARFAEAANLPVATTFHGKGVIPYRHPNAIGTVGFMRHDYENFAFDAADTIPAVGYEIKEFDPVRVNPKGGKQVIHLHAFAQDTDKSYQPALDLKGDIAAALDGLAWLVAPRASRDGGGARAMRDAELARGAEDAAFPLTPARIICDIRKALGDEDIVLADIGAGKMWMARLYPTQAPNTCIVSNELSTMAFSLPGAMGAKRAFPHKRVLASTGDAAFLMNSQEIETAVRKRIPPAVLIWEDAAYGLIKWKMDMELHEHVAVDFQNPEFVADAESFGARGVRVRRAEDLLPALEAALTSDGVTVIVRPVDYTENGRLTDRLGALTWAA